MRIRAGIVLVQDNKVALIERHRAGLDYFVFPGGGADEGETPEQAAIREAMEELGIEVVIRRKLVEIQYGRTSRQVYYWAEQVGGTFGTGVGEEYTDSDPDHPEQGVYIPIWMPIEELSIHQNIYPAKVAELVVRSQKEGWMEESLVYIEEPK